MEWTVLEDAELWLVAVGCTEDLLVHRVHQFVEESLLPPSQEYHLLRHLLEHFQLGLISTESTKTWYSIVSGSVSISMGRCNILNILVQLLSTPRVVQTSHHSVTIKWHAPFIRKFGPSSRIWFDFDFRLLLKKVLIYRPNCLDFYNTTTTVWEFFSNLTWRKISENIRVVHVWMKVRLMVHIVIILWPNDEMVITDCWNKNNVKLKTVDSIFIFLLIETDGRTERIYK